MSVWCFCWSSMCNSVEMTRTSYETCYISNRKNSLISHLSMKFIHISFIIMFFFIFNSCICSNIYQEQLKTALSFIFDNNWSTFNCFFITVLKYIRILQVCNFYCQHIFWDTLLSTLLLNVDIANIFLLLWSFNNIWDEDLHAQHKNYSFGFHAYLWLDFVKKRKDLQEICIEKRMQLI